MIDFDKMEKDVKCSDILKIIDEAMAKALQLLKTSPT